MKPETKEAIDRYVKHGAHPGDFVGAVLSDRLMRAICMASDQDRQDLHEICKYVLNTVPEERRGSCWAVKKWIVRHRQGV